jgi:monovalent cation:H+ antiporter-2, CPA2 family
MQLSLDSTGFSDALVILGAAGLVMPAFARFNISPVIGFILVGLLVGPHALGGLVNAQPWLYHFTISDPDAIKPFADFGIILLLFSCGLELSRQRLWELRRLIIGLGAAETLLCALAIAIALSAFGYGLAGAIGLGFALAQSSSALVLPMINSHSQLGRRALAMLLFEDMALVLIIFAIGILAPSATHSASLWQTLLLGSAVIISLLLFGPRLLPYLFTQAAKVKSSELFLAASLVVVILASLATTAVGLSPLLGALLAGVLIAETDYRAEVQALTEPIKGLGLGVFLLSLGMSLDLAALLTNWQAVLLAVSGIILIKLIITASLLKLSGAPGGTAVEIGWMMASPAETTLIVLAAAAAAGLVDGPTSAFWQAVSAIGLTLTPLLAWIGKRFARRIERHSPEELIPGQAAGQVLIIGCGRVGRLVAQMLDVHKLRYLALEADIDAVRSARKRGYHVQFGDATRPGMIAHLGLGEARAVVVTMDDPPQASRIIRHLRAHYPKLTIIARARDPNHAAELYRAGATDAVPETLEASLQLSEALLVELGLAMGPVIASIHDKRAGLRARIMQMAASEREPPIFRRRPKTSDAAAVAEE